MFVVNSYFARIKLIEGHRGTSDKRFFSATLITKVCRYMVIRKVLSECKQQTRFITNRVCQELGRIRQVVISCLPHAFSIPVFLSPGKQYIPSFENMSESFFLSHPKIQIYLCMIVKKEDYLTLLWLIILGALFDSLG